RVAELCALKVADLDLAERTALVHGKGSRDRRVPLGLSLTRQLLRYLRRREEHLGDRLCPYLFYSRFRGQLTPSGVRQIVKRRSRDARIEGVRTSPHTLRHSFAKAHVLNGGDAFSLQAMLGHADISTTQKYVGLDLRELRRQHDAFGPLDHIGDGD
ncbi:integrase/recombinase, partial [mine drainage metagenome]